MTEPARPALAIVPARGGSRGILRKNLRPVGGRPMLAWTLDAAIASDRFDRVVLSSDDAEILGWAALRGYDVVERPAALADAQTTIAQVAAHHADELDWDGIVAVLQPTSPLRSAESIAKAIDHLDATGATSLMSVIRNHHLSWYAPDGDVTAATPLFTERVNRQFATHGLFTETGAIQLVDAAFLRREVAMVSGAHTLFELPDSESVDIDTLDDLLAARRLAERRTIVFRLTASASVGSGHLHHCLQLAEELAEHDLVFLLRDCDAFVARLLTDLGYAHRPETDLRSDLEAIAPRRPALVVNDVLDTSADDVVLEKSLGLLVVDIEDLGDGARYADWVVNALYPLANCPQAHVSTGARYATLRTEFRDLPARAVREPGSRVLVTFGGTDPSRLTARFTAALRTALEPDVEIVVVAGAASPAFEAPDGVTVKRDVRSMASEMMEADVMLTSAGRTVYEAAATGTPVVVVAQNAREATHSHLQYDSGALFLGIGSLVDDALVVSTVERLLADAALRRELGERLRASIDQHGVERIAEGVRALLRGHGLAR
jgi:CMP-N-acetylneuraminic acid synthetase/spore coat polysaccharide biosynthesis predicted glycosyltransferase SpsG